MTFRTGQLSGNSNAASLFIATLEIDLITNGWQKVGTNVISGEVTWQVYRSLGTSNSIARTFHFAIGCTTDQTPARLWYTIFKDWDAINNLASGYPPRRPDGGSLSNGLSVNTVTDYMLPMSPRSLPNQTSDLGIVGVLPLTASGGSFNGTGTNGTTPPQFNSTSFTGTVNGVISNPTGIRSATIVSGGTGYTTAPTITFSGGGATSQATATCTVAGGVINSVTIVDRGSGYTSQPTITITPTSGGSGAVLEIRGINPVFNWVAVPTISNAGKEITQIDSSPNLGVALSLLSGSSITGSSVFALVDIGFLARNTTFGIATSDYMYSVTIDRIVLTFRANGNFLTSEYIGAYDSVLNSTADPFPVTMTHLGGPTGSSNNHVTTFSGFGISPSEPLLASQIYNITSLASQASNYSSVLPWSIAPSSSLEIPIQTMSVREGYTGKFWPSRCLLLGKGTRGSSSMPPAIRGFLKDVYIYRGDSYNSWGQEFSFFSGGQEQRCFRVDQLGQIFCGKI